MFLLYDLIFLIFAICYLPVFLFKRKFHAGFAMRLGFLPADPALKGPVWVHAVSVGEAVSVKHLVASLKEKFPQQDFVISTVTHTGNKIARKNASKHDRVIYLPLDFSFVVRRVINNIKPSLFVIAETELWPNLISCLHKINIPIVVVNARISDRSFKGYLLAKFIFKPILNKISIFCVQSKVDAERLEKLGVAPDKIMLTGNMKFDINVPHLEELKKDYTDYRVKLGLAAKDRLWVAASTHPGEEGPVLKVYQDICAENPDLKLLIAPRHPDRAASIEKLVNRYPRFKAYRVSSLAKLDVILPDPSRRPVFILDTIGQLMYFYAISDIVFVGGSLVKKGGHNILEPASFAKPVLFGKYMFNFRDIAALFLENKAGIMVNDARELEQSLKSLLASSGEISRLSLAGRQVILKNQGATSRNSEAIRSLVESRGCGKI